MENKVYALQYKDLVFQPSKCAEAWAIKLKDLTELTEQDSEFWSLVEKSVYASTGSYKLFRRSLVEKVNSPYADIAPRRPCNRRDKSGNRPESSHHTHVYYDGIIEFFKCTCESFFYRHYPDKDSVSACPHIFANMIEQTIEKQKPILPFNFNVNPEEIVNVLLLSHKHHIKHYEIDAYLFEKYDDALLTKGYKELVDAGIIRKVSCAIEKPRNLEKLLKKDYKIKNND